MKKYIKVLTSLFLVFCIGIIGTMIFANADSYVTYSTGGSYQPKKGTANGGGAYEVNDSVSYENPVGNPLIGIRFTVVNKATGARVGNGKTVNLFFSDNDKVNQTHGWQTSESTKE